MFKKDSEESALSCEKRFISKLRSAGFVLANKTDGGEGVKGFKFSKESCERRRAITTLRMQSVEARLVISAANKGKKHRLGQEVSIETRRKKSVALKNKPWSAARREAYERTKK